MDQTGKTVLVLCLYGPQAASTRLRMYPYIDWLIELGFNVKIHALMDDFLVKKRFSAFYLFMAPVYFLRLLQRLFLLIVYRNSAIFVYAEIFPGFPWIFEEALLKARAFVWCDFDDQFDLRYTRGFARLVPWSCHGKMSCLAGRADLVFVGNVYLLNYLRAKRIDSILMPTVCGVEVNKDSIESLQFKKRVTIIWIGSPSTWSGVKHLENQIFALDKLRKIRWIFVGTPEGPGSTLARLRDVVFLDWSEPAEVYALQKADIGIMPLVGDSWDEGKSGFKLIQYMTNRIACLGFSCEVNDFILDNQSCGFTYRNKNEFVVKAIELIDDPLLRKYYSDAGKERVEQVFNPEVNRRQFLEAIKAVL